MEPNDEEQVPSSSSKKGALGISFGLPVQLYQNKQGKKHHPHKKVWDPLEANLMTFEKARNQAANLTERIQKVKEDRFYTRPLESKPTLPYLQDTKQIPHLNLDNPRPAPFPHLKRPQPPPFPLPTFELSNDSLDNVEVSNEVPKIPSMIHELSEEPHIDAAKLDAERKYRPLLGPRMGRTKLNVSKLPKNSKSKPPPQLAQQAMEWEHHLRDLSAMGQSATSTQPRPSSYFGSNRLPSKPKKLLDPPLPAIPPLDNTLELIAARIRNDSDDSLVSPPQEEHEVGQGQERRQHKKKDNKYDISAYFQMAPKARVIPNRTIKVAEDEMNHIQKLTSVALNMVQTKRFDLNKKTRFYINDGMPTLLEQPIGNSFAAAETLRIPFKNRKHSTQEVKKFIVDMNGFKDKELSFYVDGHIISVIGHRPEDLTHHRRGVVETVVLPPYLNLNKIRISRDYGGRVILEELRDF